jgi:hypothetical protein
MSSTFLVDKKGRLFSLYIMYSFLGMCLAAVATTSMGGRPTYLARPNAMGEA